MRRCKYCGVDISHLRANAVICGSVKCASKAKQDCLKTKNKSRFCEVCGCSIDHLARQRRICIKPECISEQKRRKYKTARVSLVCNKCGKQFYGTAKQVCCPECKMKPRSSPTPMRLQTLVCKYCEAPLQTVYKHLTPRTLPAKKFGVCDKCKCTNKEKIRQRMRSNNPMFDKVIVSKARISRKLLASSAPKQRSSSFKKEKAQIKSIKTNNKVFKVIINIYKSLEIIKKYTLFKVEIPSYFYYIFDVVKTCKCIRLSASRMRASRRMQEHNPMRNPQSKAKMMTTMLKKRLNGEFIVPKGVDSPLWKGNRPLNKAVRIELRKWVRSKMEEVNFVCQRCGKTKTELHVHHIKPLRKIIQEFLTLNNITTKQLTAIEGTSEYFAFIDSIVQYHYNHPEVGIVVCPECHNEVDKQYKRKTHDSKKCNKKTI